MTRVNRVRLQREFEAAVKATRAAVQRGESWIVLPYADYLRLRADRIQLNTIRAMVAPVRSHNKRKGNSNG